MIDGPGREDPAGSDPSPAASPGARRWTRRGRRLAIALAVLGSANTLAQAVRGIRFPVRSDWPAFAGAGRVLATSPGSLYDIGAVSAAQRQVLAGQAADFFVPFRSPPLVALLYEPFSRLPLTVGVALFAALSLAALGAAILLIRRLAPWSPSAPSPLLLAVLAATLLPVGEAFAYSQPVAVILLAVVAGLLLRSRGHPLSGGLLLGAAIAKPQLIWLVVPLLVVLSEWRMLAGLAGGALVWLISGALLVGPGWLPDWLRSAVWNGSEVSISNGLPSLASLVSHSEVVGNATAVVCLGVWLALIWRWRDALRSRPVMAIAVAFAASLVAAPHVFAHDLMLLAPAIVLGAGMLGQRVLLAVLAIDLVYLVESNISAGVAQVDGLVLLAVTAGLFAATVAPRRPASSILAKAGAG